eukprot:515014-Pelagomonas_calceolata.AAC.3
MENLQWQLWKVALTPYACARHLKVLWCPWAGMRHRCQSWSSRLVARRWACRNYGCGACSR